MPEVIGYTISDMHPKIAEAYWPYFIVRLQTTEGAQVELRFHKRALQCFAEEIKKYLSKEAPN